MRRRNVDGVSAGVPGAPEGGWELFAIAAPGLEPWVAGELAALGIEPRVEAGGVAFRGGMREIYDANLHLRTASRVVARFGELDARTFAELERGARRIAWDRVLAAGRPIALRVASRKSRLYHTGAIAERIERAIAEGLGGSLPRSVVGSGEDENDGEDGSSLGGDARSDRDDASVHEGDAADAQLILVRVHRDRVTLSADTSGALLHRRGYRQATAKAPLRETLAAAVLVASGWVRPTGPFLDPMCGAGTLAIEAALIARRIAPGLRRDFSILRWPGHDEPLWRERREAAEAAALPASPVPIHASDRDAGAIEAARANAERAGVAADLVIERRALSAIEPPAGWGAAAGARATAPGAGVEGEADARTAAASGLLVTNPPYGVRVGEPGPLRDLYAQLGHVARARFPGWTLALLATDPRLVAQLRIPLAERLRTVNGGIAVRLMAGRVTGA